MPPRLEPALETKRSSRRRGEVTAERVLDAAESLFAERGFAGTTLRQVADLVGIQNPSLYNYFDSKEALYAAVLERGLGPVLDAMTGFQDLGPGESQDPGKVVARMMELLSQRPDLPRLILHETLRSGPHLTPMLREWIAPTLVDAEQLVERSPAAKRWEPAQIPLLVLAMYQIVVGYFAIAPFYRELSGVDLLSEEALARQTRFLGDVVGALFEPKQPDA